MANEHFDSEFRADQLSGQLYDMHIYTIIVVCEGDQMYKIISTKSTEQQRLMGNVISFACIWWKNQSIKRYCWTISVFLNILACSLQIMY